MSSAGQGVISQGTVDWQAKLIADKTLTVCHILGILALNLLVLFRVYKRIKSAGVSPRLQLIVSLVCGDMLLALFPMTVDARTFFETNPILECKTLLLAIVYRKNVLPFAYTMGLITMGVEMLLRRKIANGGVNNILVSLAFSAIPWILALVIALPVAVAGTVWNSCARPFTLERARSIEIVCILIPSFVALVVSVVVARSKPQNSNSNDTNALGVGPNQLALVETQPQFQPNPNQQPHTGQQLYIGQQLYTGQQPQSGQQLYIGQQPHTGQQPHIGQQLYIGQPHTGQQLYIDQQPQTGHQLYINHKPHEPQSTGPVWTLALVQREKFNLLVVSLIFFFFSLPMVCFDLYKLSSQTVIMKAITFTVIDCLLFWFFQFRCILTALCWFRELR